MSTITTNIQFDRTFTEEEKPIRDAHLREQLAAGLLITDDPTNFDIQPAIGVRVWSTEDAANAYIAWVTETFDPPPVSSKVEII